jgi:O-antigen/teichoic acid export membrane protein
LNKKLKAYVSGGTAIVIAKGISLAAAFAVVWLLNNILGKEIYGAYAAALAVLQLSAVIGLVGLDQTIIYRLSRRSSEPGSLTGGGFVRSVLATTIPLSVIVAGTVIIVSKFGLTDNINQQPIEPHLLFGLAIAIPLINAQKVFAAWYQARHRVAEAVLVPASLNLSRAILLGIAFFLWPTQGGVTLGILISFAVPVLVWMQKTPPKCLLTSKESLNRQDISYGLKLAISSLAGHGLRNINVIMVGLLSSATYTAEYAVAAQLTAILHLGDTVMRPVFTPRLGRHLARQNIDSLRREYGQNRLLGLVIAIVIAVIFVEFGKPILSLFGDYQSAYSMLLVIMATTIFAIGFGASGQYLNMAGYAGWSLSIQSMLLIGSIILNLFLIPILGGLGAALASFASIGVVNVLLTWLIWRLDRLPTLNLTVALAMLITNGTLMSVVFWNLNHILASIIIAIIASFLVLLEKSLWYPVAVRIAKLIKK